MSSRKRSGPYTFHDSLAAGREKKSRRCNLCSEHFRPRSPHERYCRSCRERDELLRYSDWMGELIEEVPIKSA